METIKGWIFLVILVGLSYGAIQVTAAEGWQNGAIFLLVSLFFIGFVKGLADLLLAPFTRQGD